MRDRLPLAIGVVLLALALLVGLSLVGDGIRARGQGDTISVTGSAKRRISSDFVIWSASLSAQAETTEAATTQLGGWVERSRAVLRAAGIRDAELAVAPISTETLTRGNTIFGYRLSRSVEVRSERIDVVLGAIEASSKLLGEGIPIAAAPPQFVYTKLAALRPAMSADATKDAITRAEAVVAITGDKLGHIKSVGVSPFQLTAPGSTEVSDYGVYDTSTREKDVTAVVNVAFAVK
jgi:hypothetical protein